MHLPRFSYFVKVTHRIKKKKIFFFTVQLMFQHLGHYNMDVHKHNLLVTITAASQCHGGVMKMMIVVMVPCQRELFHQMNKSVVSIDQLIKGMQKSTYD